MVNKCVASGCKSGYVSNKNIKSVPTFRFPLDKPDLLKKWVQFVNRSNWSAAKNSVLCGKHFQDKFVLHGEKHVKLNWTLNPIPTLHTDIELKRSSTLQNPLPAHKLPKPEFFKKMNSPFSTNKIA